MDSKNKRGKYLLSTSPARAQTLMTVGADLVISGYIIILDWATVSGANILEQRFSQLLDWQLQQESGIEAILCIPSEPRGEDSFSYQPRIPTSTTFKELPVLLATEQIGKSKIDESIYTRFNWHSDELGISITSLLYGMEITQEHF